MERDNVATGPGNLQELGIIPMPIADSVTALTSQPAAERLPDINAPACNRASGSFIGDDLAQVLDAVFGEGGDAVLADAADPEAAVFWEHVG